MLLNLIKISGKHKLKRFQKSKSVIASPSIFLIPANLFYHVRAIENSWRMEDSLQSHLRAIQKLILLEHVKRKMSIPREV